MSPFDESVAGGEARDPKELLVDVISGTALRSGLPVLAAAADQLSASSLCIVGNDLPEGPPYRVWNLDVLTKKAVVGQRVDRGFDKFRGDVFSVELCQ